MKDYYLINANCVNLLHFELCIYYAFPYLNGLSRDYFFLLLFSFFIDPADFFDLLAFFVSPGSGFFHLKIWAVRAGR